MKRDEKDSTPEAELDQAQRAHRQYLIALNKARLQSIALSESDETD